MTDVLIAGAGIAGSALAIHLGRCGYSVALFERGRFPREKPCGEGLMPAGVVALERLGVETARLGAEFRGIRYHFDGRMAEARFQQSYTEAKLGRGIRRRELDTALVSVAAKTPGVTVYTGARVSGPLLERGRVTGLLVEGHPIRARLVVGADGAQSRLRHALNLNSASRRKRLGICRHFRPPLEAEPRTHVEVFLGRGHELYVTPLRNGEILVAALAEAAAIHGRVEELFRRWCEGQSELAAVLRNAEPASELLVTAPLAGRARRRVLPKFVLLGDAAGFTDPITGGGMTQALQSAELLAEHLAAEPDWSERFLESFDRTREKMLLDYRRLTAAMLWLGKHPPLIGPALRTMGSVPSLFSHLLSVAGGARSLLGHRRLIPSSCGNMQRSHARCCEGNISVI
jgi:menaquinone-9 beta-reductase